MAYAENTDNSGTAVVLGILLALAIVVSGYFFLKNEGAVGTDTASTTNIEMPDVNVSPAAGTPADDAPAAP